MESTFGSRVREYRKFKGLSQTAFAEQCGLEQGNITQMEKGTEPKQSNVAKIIGGFPDLNPDWLLLGAGAMLRGGRVLAPAPPVSVVAEAEPLSYGDAVELAVANARIADRDETIRQQQYKIDELNRELGKPFNGLDAASSTAPVTPRAPIGFALSVSNRVKSKGAARSL